MNPHANGQGPRDGVVTLTDDTFDQAISATQPIVVDFYLDSCGPCRALEPVLAELAAEHAGALRIAKLRLDQAPQVAARFELTAVPTLIVFAGGQPQTRITAFDDRGQLARELNPFVPTHSPLGPGQ